MVAWLLLRSSTQGEAPIQLAVAQAGATLTAGQMSRMHVVLASVRICWYCLPPAVSLTLGNRARGVPPLCVS